MSNINLIYLVGGKIRKIYKIIYSYLMHYKFFAKTFCRSLLPLYSGQTDTQQHTYSLSHQIRFRIFPSHLKAKWKLSLVLDNMVLPHSLFLIVIAVVVIFFSISFFFGFSIHRTVRTSLHSWCYRAHSFNRIGKAASMYQSFRFHTVVHEQYRIVSISYFPYEGMKGYFHVFVRVKWTRKLAAGNFLHHIIHSVISHWQFASNYIWTFKYSH